MNTGDSSPPSPSSPGLLLSRVTRRRFFASLPWMAPGFLLSVPALARTPPAVTALPEIEDLPPAQPWLEKWRSAARIPIRQSADPAIRLLLHAVETDRSLTVRYFGGSHPGQTRRIQPAFLFTVEGYEGHYVIAYDHDKQQNRAFRLRRMEIVE